MKVYKEYNYDVETGTLLSISNQADPLVNNEILFLKRDLDGRFVEKYIVHGDGFASINSSGEITDTYTRDTGEFLYGCNVRYIRNDGRTYYAQNPVTDVELIPHSESIKQLLSKHHNVVELIYVEKTVGVQIYIIKETIT